MNVMIRIATGRGLIHNIGGVARQCQNFRPTAGMVVLSSRNNSGGSSSSSSTPPPPPTSNSNTGEGAAAAVSSAKKYAKTTAGTGDPEGLGGGGASAFSMRGPVTWPALGLVAVAAASAVSYYKIERERRLENAMGKIVSDVLKLYGSSWISLPHLYLLRHL